MDKNLSKIIVDGVTYIFKDGEARTDIATLEGIVESNKTELNNKIIEVSDNVDLVSGKADEAINKANEVEGVVEGFSGTLTELNNSIQSNLDQINGVKTDIITINNNIDLVNERITELHDVSGVYGRILGVQASTNVSEAIIIPYSSVSKSGTGLTLDDTGKVTVGAGVNRIECSFMIEGQAGADALTGDITYGIRKNGAVVYKGFAEDGISAYEKSTFGLPTFELDVAEGDYLQVILYSEKTFVVNSGYTDLSYLRVRQVA